MSVGFGTVVRVRVGCVVASVLVRRRACIVAISRVAR